LKHKYPAAQPAGAMGLVLGGALDRDELQANEAHARAKIANVPIECAVRSSRAGAFSL
jgi:hypothetical protein